MNRTKHRTALQILLLHIAALLLPVAAGAQTQAVDVFDAWVERLGAEEVSADELEIYVAENFHPTFLQQVPTPQAVGFLNQLRAGGPFSDVAYEETTADAVRAKMKGRDGSWLEAQLVLHPEDRKIVGLLVEPSSAPEESSWTTLDELATQLRETFDLPGLAIAVARGGKVEQAVAGVREIGTDVAVEMGDRFHIGSISKSVTATALAGVVEDGKLSWDATLAELLPWVDAEHAYAAVDVKTLLRHQARIQQHLMFDEEGMTRLNTLPGTTTEQRAAYVREVLALEPLESGYHYSNAGYALAGYLAERASGAAWEELVHQKVFGPLELESCGVGWPATSERPNEPRGHYAGADGLRAQGLDEYTLGAFMAPAGNLHCSALDLTRYGLAHLRGLQGEDGFLAAASVKELHRVREEGGVPYAAGWGLDPETGLHRHNGSAGTFFSYLAIHPEKDLVITLLANAGPQLGGPAAQKMTSEILERFGSSP